MLTGSLEPGNGGESNIFESPYTFSSMHGLSVTPYSLLNATTFWVEVIMVMTHFHNGMNQNIKSYCV